jgi:hypothetical protein
MPRSSRRISAALGAGAGSGVASAGCSVIVRSYTNHRRWRSGGSAQAARGRRLDAGQLGVVRRRRPSSLVRRGAPDGIAEPPRGRSAWSRRGTPARQVVR